MAGAGIFIGVFGLVFYLFILLLPIALLVVLQVWLCRKNLKLGLILPGISLLLSVLLTLVLVINLVGAALTNFIAVGIVFLVTNIPTVVFGGIWLHYKGRRDTLEDLKKMRIEDLE